MHRSKHFSSPGRLVHSDTNSASLGSILTMQKQLFTHMSTTVYSQVLIYTAESTGIVKRQKYPNYETIAKGIRTWALSLYCVSGILPLSYRAPQCSLIYFFCNTYSAKLSEFHIHDDLHILLAVDPTQVYYFTR